MLGRADYTPAELDHAKASITKQIAAFKKLADAAAASGDPAVSAALEAFEPLFFDNLVMVLDRYFVHRIRKITGKDGNPLNEVELLTESLLRDGVLQTNTVIKYVAEDSIVKLEPGTRIELDAGQFDRLAKAYFAEIKARFL